MERVHLAELNQMRSRLFATAAVSCSILLASCGGKDENGTADASDAVVLYVSADDYVARQVVADFEEQTGINVEMLGDTEAKKTTGLVERLRAEKDNPKADVFWSSEVFMTIELADEGVLAPFVSDAIADWPQQHRDPENRWYGFGARARVIVYAPSRLHESEVPETWLGLVEPKWAGRIAMADPRFGTTGGHLGAMRAYWRTLGPAFYSAFAEGLADNDVALLTSGNAGVVQGVALGEYDLGMTDTDDVWAAQANGLDVALVYPRHDADPNRPSAGTLLIPNTVARVAGGPNEDNAGRLIEYLLSERVERILAESDSHNVPLRPSLADAYPQYTVPDPLEIDYDDASEHRVAATNELLNAIKLREQRADDEPVEREEFRPRSYTEGDGSDDDVTADDGGENNGDSDTSGMSAPDAA